MNTPTTYWDIAVSVAAILNILFLAYNLFELYLKKLNFSLYIDNWIDVTQRCCDPSCENPHLDFRCTLVCGGPKNKNEALYIKKTELECPSGLKVEVSPNNHVSSDGKFWGNQTPIILSGGEKLSFDLSYKPEMENFKTGKYSLKICLASKSNKKVVSRIERFEITEEKLTEIQSLPNNCHTQVGTTTEDD